MKRLLTAAAMAITLSGAAQVIYSGGVGLSHVTSVVGFAEVGGRIGPILYVGGQVSGNSDGYPALSIGSVIGAAHSWNNNKMHELTTVLYAKADYPIAANSGYKSDPPVPFGIGIAHYVYNARFDLSYQHRQVQFTVGYSLRNIYR